MLARRSSSCEKAVVWTLRRYWVGEGLGTGKSVSKTRPELGFLVGVPSTAVMSVVVVVGVAMGV